MPNSPEELRNPLSPNMSLGDLLRVLPQLYQFVEDMLQVMRSNKMEVDPTCGLRLLSGPVSGSKLLTVGGGPSVTVVTGVYCVNNQLYVTQSCINLPAGATVTAGAC